MTLLQILGLISALGAAAGLVALSCRGAESMSEPEADGGPLDFNGMSAWPGAQWREQVDGGNAFVRREPCAWDCQ